MSYHFSKFSRQLALLFSALAIFLTPHHGLAHDVVNDGTEQLIIDDSGDRIVIEINNTPLQIALDSIQEKSGIAFKVPDDFKNRVLSISVSETDWLQAAKSVLRDYDIVAMGEPASTQIWLIGEKIKSPSKKMVRSPARKDPLIPRFKLLTRFPPGMALPRILFENPEVQAFLMENDIQSPENWKDFRKARLVREKAKLYLEQLLAKNTGN